MRNQVGGIKVAHAIAQSGLASRREAEAWLGKGLVALKGKPLLDPARRLSKDEVKHLRVRGAPLPAIEPVRVWRYHKPRGVLVERRGQKTGARKIGKSGQAIPYLDEVLPKPLRGYHPIGRLDLDSEGLLLLTNNGALKRALELPRNQVGRVYRLRVFGFVSKRDLDRLARGPKLDGRKTEVRSVRLLGGGAKKSTAKRASQGGGQKATKARENFWLEVALAEGRGRELRRLATLFGWRVNRLIRVQYGEVRLGRLPPSALAEVAPAVVERLCAVAQLDTPKKKTQNKNTKKKKIK